MAAVDRDTARAAKRQLAAEIGGEPNVNGIGLAPVHDGWVLKVNLRSPRARVAIPRQVDGVDVKVEVTGRAMRQALV